MENETAADPVPDEVLSIRVHDEIRLRIIDGRLRPGDRIRERDLAEELRVSRVPIREALPALERGGYVRILPRRSAVVTAVTARDVAELYDLRASLEPLAARTAARRVAAGTRPDDVDSALSDAAAALEAGDHDAFGAANSAFHGAIERLADSGLLITTMRPLHERSTRLNAVTLVRDPRSRHAEHVALRDAIAAGHAELAAALAYAHVELGRARTVATLGPDPD